MYAQHKRSLVHRFGGAVHERQRRDNRGADGGGVWEGVFGEGLCKPSTSKAKAENTALDMLIDSS